MAITTYRWPDPRPCTLRLHVAITIYRWLLLYIDGNNYISMALWTCLCATYLCAHVSAHVCAHMPVQMSAHTCLCAAHMSLHTSLCTCVSLQARTRAYTGVDQDSICMPCECPKLDHRPVHPLACNRHGASRVQPAWCTPTRTEHAH